MKKRILVVLLALFGSGFLFNLNIVKAETEEKPILRIPVFSDTHICGKPELIGTYTACTNNSRNQRLVHALEDYANIAPGADAYAIVGDLTDHGLQSQYDEFNNILNRYLPLDSKKVLTMGNHDFFAKRYDPTITDEDLISRYLQNTGQESLYYDQWIGGYHFISLSGEKTTQDGLNSDFLSEEQYLWLEKALPYKAVDDRPIFVFIHQPIKGTIYGSDLWGSFEDGRLESILEKYPQVILFSGHSHYLLNHPRTIYQEGFTMVNTGSVNYSFYDGGEVSEPSQGLLVDVYKDRVVIKARDFIEKTWVNQFEINTPYKKTYFDHLKPYFKDGSKIVLEKNEEENKTTLYWDAAVDNTQIDKYIIKVNGNIVKTKYNRFWEEASIVQSETIPNLSEDIDNIIEITAVDAWGNGTLNPLKLTLEVPKKLSGWVNENDAWYYYDPETGEKTKGWLVENQNKYYFDDSGAMLTGWQEIESKLYFFSAQGIMQTGWEFIDNKWRFFSEDGVMQTGWLETEGKWYYLNEKGEMQTKWFMVDKVWYYFSSQGERLTGWQKVDGIWYFMDDKGKLVTDWVQSYGKWYYMTTKGMAVGWHNIDHVWYFFKTDGVMQTGWLKSGSYWYYLSKSGAMISGWKYIDGSWYYFYNTGKMASNTVIDGFVIGSDGKMK